MDYLGIGLTQAFMTVFCVAVVLYFCVDVLWLARQNDRLKKRLNRLEQDVRELRR